MKLDKNALLVYAVTDRSWLNGATLEEQVEAAIKGGATFLQLREKDADEKTFLSRALGIKKIANQYHIPFIINDNIEIALACDADGVHVGQSDMETGMVRQRLGDQKIIGVSVRTVEEAILAQAQGADYLGVGAVFTTSTKLDAADVSFETLKEICHTVSIPVVAIGGINADNMLQLKGSGIAGVAVVSAIFASDDIASATEQLVSLAKEITQ